MGSFSEPSYLGNPITSTDKLLGHVCFMGKVFKIFKSQPYSACHLFEKTQTAYSFRYCKHCEHFKTIRMQNLKQQLVEICFIIKVMMAQSRIFIHFCGVVLVFFVKTVIACFGLERRPERFAKILEPY